jgi:hypothetical protein
MHRSISRILILLGAGMFSTGLVTSCGGNDGDDARASCGIAGTKCDYGCTPSLGCTECVSNADCSDAGKPACVLGKCRECGPEVSCSAAQACFPRDSKCEARCASDGDCPGDAPICMTEAGACVGCRTDADCASTSGTPICEPIRAQCSECASNADCGAAAPACDLNDGKCHECLIDANCPLSSLCGEDRKCHRACTSNASCDDPSKPFCDLTSKDCVACLVNSDCGEAEPVCHDDKCVQCTVDADCTSPATPVCGGDKCQGCVVDADCTNPALPVCKDDVCVQCHKDDDCTDPEFPHCADEECVAK